MTLKEQTELQEKALLLVKKGSTYFSAGRDVGLSIWLVKKYCEKHNVKSRRAGDPSKARAARIANSRFLDPEARKRHSEAIKKSYTSELKDMRSQKTSEQWDDKRQQAVVGVVLTKNGELDYNPPNDLKTVRKALYERAGAKCEQCGLTEEESLEKDGRKLSLHHLSYEKIIPDLEDTKLLCQSCHIKLHGRNATQEDRRKSVLKAVGNLLETLGVPKHDPNFEETPRRFGEYLLEHFVSQDQFDSELESYGSATFPSTYTGMITQTGIETFGMCPHHMLPIIYKVAIGYIPEKETIGLSKLARLVETCSKLPILQESLTKLITNSMMRILHTPDVAVVISGMHMCMVCRGIKAYGSSTITCSLEGVFEEIGNPARSEFLTYVTSVKKD